MQTITKTYNLYKFEELEEEVKKRLLKKENEQQCEIFCEYCLEEEMQEEAMQLLEKYFGDKMKLNRIFYSLGYSQGDGAMMEFEGTYCNKYIRVKQNGFYRHPRAFTISEMGDLLTEKQYAKLKEKIIKMNDDLTKYGYLLIEDDFTEASLCYFEDKLFLKNGEMWED